MLSNQFYKADWHADVMDARRAVDGIYFGEAWPVFAIFLDKEFERLRLHG